MYYLYNAILRRFPIDVYDASRKGGNLFSTTILVLLSALQKLCRVEKVAPGTILFRGLGDKDLPSFFYKPDDLGCQGFAEWGFMSTTSNRAVAQQYSGLGKDGHPEGRVLVIETGAVDRGACIMKYSQYIDEEEFLWLLLSFVQPNGDPYIEVAKEGWVKLVPVRVIPNLKAGTVKEARERKKTAHLAAFRFLVEELREELKQIAEKRNAAERYNADLTKNIAKSTTVDGLISSIVAQCEERLEAHKMRDAADFAEDEVFQALVKEVLDVKTMARYQFLYWLEDRSQYVAHIEGRELGLRDARRGYVSFLRRKASEGRKEAVLKVLKLRGVVQSGVHEVDHDGETPLVRAASDGLLADDLRLPIEAGAGVNERTGTRLNPLMEAARHVRRRQRKS